ncbi:MAG: preprotein translocase subunit SecA, partial [Erysipelotrichaceae bacterium]
MSFLDQIFNVEKKRIKELEIIANKVESLKETFKGYTDEQLKENTFKYQERIADGESLDAILPEAYANIREAALRVINEYPYHVQLLGAIALHQGDIAEMKTGEGKTLTSIMPVYLNALSRKGVHVVTVNEYLAGRDANWMGKIYRFLGLSVGVNLRALTPSDKRAAYNCDITYSTNAELGFDYLRDNMAVNLKDKVQRELNFALVDEVDSILIDESRTPLIISGGEKETANLYLQADKFAKMLNAEDDYQIDVKDKIVTLTESGIKKGEKYFNLKNLYDLDHTNIVHHINQALKANYIMSNDVEYVVNEGKIVIVDQFTGRLMPGRAYSDGLHQAIEAKEKVKVNQETSTLATITYQNYFRLYSKLAGMTGTAKTEEEEFLKIYNMRVITIPTNRPVIRIDAPDAIYGTQKAKYNALIDEIVERHKTGQPILVGTISVETSELISKMLKRAGVKHEILNAKNHAREANIIENAGQKFAVTIATNMAGRGTDIKINDEVKSLGGLAVLGSERHESRRIDNQLRGRSGRQGDPGFSQFYVSIQDELMVRFGGSKVEALFTQLGDNKIESSMITKSISSAQKRVEGMNFDIRKTLLDYDDVLRQQREIIYEQRDEILEKDDVHDLLKDMFGKVIEGIVDRHIETTGKETELNIGTLKEGLEKYGVDITNIDFSNYSLNNLSSTKDDLINIAWNQYSDKIKPYYEQMLPIEKTMVLRFTDRIWVDHIDIMSKLRDGIG